MKESSIPQPNPSQAQPLHDAIIGHIDAWYQQGRYQEALDSALLAIRDYPDIAAGWIGAAVICGRLGRWQEAISYGQTALAHGGDSMPLYDVLAHACGWLKQWDEARRYGLRALDMRVRRFGGDPVIPLPEPGPMPPLPGVQTRERNIIAFSLFGNECKYCEPAVLNVLEQPRLYPYWVCRFYVDGSVPDGVIRRMRAGGAQIVPVDGPAAQWPGEMWRFLALDDPQAHRVLFRDADSVISRREAGAVQQWLTSGKRFHMMRDAGSHTELMMAGMWGAVCGSLPPLHQLVERFMSVPIPSRHFADQHFLRQYVWPYARTSLMQHDSTFGFMDAVPFPDGARPADGFTVGCSDDTSSFAVKTGWPDGSDVTWSLYWVEKRDEGQPREELVCSYPAAVKDSAVKINVPVHYARRLQQGTARVRITRLPGDGAAV